MDKKQIILSNIKYRWLPTPGNIIFSLLLVSLLILTQQVWATPAQTTEAPGPSAMTINYQGHLAAPNGTPKNGSFDMSFAIYNAANGGTRVWGPETHNTVPVSNGIFNIGLGSKTSGGIPTTTWNGDRYLEITVDGETLTPRELIRSVPVAGMALTVPDKSISQKHLNISPPNLLGFKSCHGCGTTSEIITTDHWVPVKGESVQDVIEVTVTTHGQLITVHMTSRLQVPTSTRLWCGIDVYQGNTFLTRAHLDGTNDSRDWGCSGVYVFDDLPAGTYTFRAIGFSDILQHWTFDKVNQAQLQLSADQNVTK